MVQLTLKFATDYFEPNDEAYGIQAWLTHVMWRDANRRLIGTGQGVYIIDDGTRPVYAGSAANLRGRFDGRSDALNELKVTTVSAGLQNYRVFTASVTSTPQRLPNTIKLAERWLVRCLYLYDQVQPAKMLQNILLTGVWTIPGGGINIRFDPGDAPAYLIAGANYQVLGANSAGYDYAAGVNY